MEKEKLLSDQSARDRAMRDLDTTFLVEAAAGTGKTTILIRRILAIVGAGRASLREIAAITFTEKAAGDLKVRLREAVEEALRKQGAKAPQGLRAALTELEGMPVNTIHGFCADLIRERPVEAGVEPGFAVADELGASLILEEAWQAWLAEQMATENPAIRRAVEMGIPLEAAGRRESPIFNLASTLIEKRDALSPELVEPPWPDERFAEAAKAIRAIVAELVAARDRDCTAPDSDLCARQIEKLRRWASQECRLPNADCRMLMNHSEIGNPKSEMPFDALRAWLAGAPRILARGGAQGNWSSKAALQAAKAGCARLKEEIERASGEVAHRVLGELAEWLRPFLDRYAKAKAARRALDFMDLLVKARDMLRDDRAARDYFKGEFRFVLVDEFQDTDPLQTEIVFFLCERPDEHAAGWEQVNLVPGKLFIVGDPKQSIYRFRRADLNLYGKVRAAISRPLAQQGNTAAAQGETLQLFVNFRTVPGIVAELNPLFERLMRGPVGERFEPPHVALEANRADVAPTPCVLIPCPPPNLREADLSAPEWRAKESGCIAELIRNLNAGKVGGRKPVEYRDIAVLYRAATGLDSLEDSLRAHDVPYQVSGGRRYYARMEFQDLLAVLKAMDNPYDPLSVVGALRSPFFGHSDEDLLSHFAAGGPFDVAQGRPEGSRTGGKFNYLFDVPQEFPKLGEAFATLKGLHEALRRNPVPAVIARLFEETQALQIYAMKPHGEQRVANLLKVQDIARALADAGVSSPSALVRWLGEMESARQAEPESPVAEPEENFVQLMTVHKAKGLEFPVVITAHLGTESPEEESVLLDRERGRLQLNFGSDKRTRGWEAAMAEETDRAEYERRRLFYVALTRAKDLLVLPAYWAKSADAAFLEYLNERYAPEERRAVCATPGVEIVPTDSFDLDKRSRDTLRLKPTRADTMPPEAEAFAAHRRDWQARLSDRAKKLSAGRKIRTASEMEMRNGDFGMRNIVAPDDSARRTAASARRSLMIHEALTSSGSHAVQFGKLAHKLMETVDFCAPGDLALLADAEARGLDLTPADVQDGVKLVRRALSLPLLADRAAKAEELYREVPFAFMGAGTLYEGYVDLVFLEDGAPVIVDYKTDSVTESEAPERAKVYAPQAEIYSHAITAALGRPVKEFYVLFLRPGVAVCTTPLDCP